MLWYENELELLQATMLVYNDTIPKKLDAVYLFGHTPENEIAILEHGATLVREGRTSRLLLCGGGRYFPSGDEVTCAYSGGISWKKQLISHGVPDEKIELLPRPAGLSHTGTEALQLAFWAIENTHRPGFKLGVVTVTGHLLRAFTNTISVFGDRPISVYAIPPKPLPWFQEASWSQGEGGQTRLESLEGELDRLNRYYAKGDIVSAGKVIQYIKKREGW